MKPLEILGEALTPAGSDMTLARRDTEYIILANGKPLMSSRMHGSEEALATFACRHARTLEEPCVLVGGLGMGYTLRATLDVLPREATVIVAELVPAVVEWNRGPLGPLAGHPLKDKRARIESGDVAETLRGGINRFDAILLDVDNGPTAFTSSINDRLYDNAGRGRRICRPEAAGHARRMVRLGRPEIRAAPALYRLPPGSRTCARPSEEGRSAPTPSLSATSLLDPRAGA